MGLTAQLEGGVVPIAVAQLLSLACIEGASGVHHGASPKGKSLHRKQRQVSLVPLLPVSLDVFLFGRAVLGCPGPTP